MAASLSLISGGGSMAMNSRMAASRGNYSPQDDGSGNLEAVVVTQGLGEPFQLVVVAAVEETLVVTGFQLDAQFLHPALVDGGAGVIGCDGLDLVARPLELAVDDRALLVDDQRGGR